MVLFIVAAVFVVLGLAIGKFKIYGLISGYNRMSEEEKAQVDVEKLARLVSNYCYFLAAMFVGLAAAEIFNWPQLVLPLIVIILISTVYLSIQSQKYNRKIYDANGKVRPGMKKKARLPVIISVAVLVGVGGLLFFLMQPANVTLEDNTLKIGGMYGDDYPLADMSEIELLDTLPEISMRLNGAAIGNKMVGYFKLFDGPKVKLFVDQSEPPFISFVVKGKRVIFNTPSPEETKQLYTQLAK